MVEVSTSLIEQHADWFILEDTPDSFKLQYRNTNIDIVNMFKYIGYQYYDTKAVDAILRRYMPRMSISDNTLMTHYTNSTKYKDDLRTPVKPGKLLKKIFPMVMDSQVESVSNWYKNKYIINTNNLVYKIGTTKEDFKHAYCDNKRSEALSSSFFDKGFKSSSDSCMRDKFSFSNGIHPTEAYASGDFEVHYLEDDKGKVHARCVVCVNTKDGPSFSRAPIYAANLNAAKYLSDKLNSKKEFGSWVGARLLKIPVYNADSYIKYIGPYMDTGVMLGKNDENNFYLATSEYDNNYYSFNSSGYCEIPKSWIENNKI